MHIPIQTNLPRLNRLVVEWRGRHFSLPYLYREGTGGPAILFVHGLGGAKENFYAAFQSPALADCTLATFDEPGTGLAAFDPDAGLDVSALADMAQGVADQFLPSGFYKPAGAISLMYERKAVEEMIDWLLENCGPPAHSIESIYREEHQSWNGDGYYIERL